MADQIVGVEVREINEANGEEVLDVVIDIEEYALSGKRPPNAKRYRIKVNGEKFEVAQRFITGREVLTVAKLLPPENYTLRVKLVGHQPQKVELDEKVDLRHPGTEKFKAMPRDQTEG